MPSTQERLRLKRANDIFFSGNADSDKQKYADAIIKYSEAIKLYPDFLDAYHNRAIAHLILGHQSEAEADFTQAIKIKPSHTHGYVQRGLIYIKKGEFQKAINDFTRVIEINDKNEESVIGEAYYNRAVGRRSLNGYKDEVAADLAMAIKVMSKTSSPHLAQVHCEYGSYFNANGNKQLALEHYNEALRLNPDLYEAQVNLDLMKGYANPKFLSGIQGKEYIISGAHRKSDKQYDKDHYEGLILQKADISESRELPSQPRLGSAGSGSGYVIGSVVAAGAAVLAFAYSSKCFARFFKKNSHTAAAVTAEHRVVNRSGRRR